MRGVDMDDQTELEFECDSCSEYIIMRLEEEELTEENLSMWIHDHFYKIGVL